VKDLGTPKLNPMALATLGLAVTLVALAGCASATNTGAAASDPAPALTLRSTGAVTTSNKPVPPGSIAASARPAATPGGGLDRGLDGSVASGTHVPIESQVGIGYLIDVAVGIEVGHAAAQAASKSPQVGEYEVAHVALTVRDGNFPYSSAQFTFVDKGGHRFPAADDSAFPPSLGAGTAVAGQTITGNVVFDVPAGGGTVELDDVSGPRLSGWTTTH
jgi:hypothetical protein